ncbi:TIGR03086 family metal-binding protein [Crossiella cryophila]|uniref:Uncharacterized protein (TIGR03086 family) n=1 Tax=Crossiella cryophila TaxID=43355 RepID=A0A7W7CHI6_9PSEU|nr:TIGR03086 family metal-binding protein [Crossiella cryophila]MBB4681314.1 uncharacterized protein (TIGR03086 family) [Crossiella cryophila]
MTMIDHGAATARMTELLAGVTDAQLTAPTPCANYQLGDLIEHIGTLALAFTQAAGKQPSDDLVPDGDAARLEPDWRTTIAAQLGELAVAWRDPAAWTGMTKAGGLDMPAEMAGQVTLNELVVHGWDVARATGQDYLATDAEVAAALIFVEPFSGPEGTEGLFGPAVAVAGDAPPLDRLLGLSGRDPRWVPAG